MGVEDEFPEIKHIRPMLLEGRLGHARARLDNMTDEERAYRKQWLKDQELMPDEPRPVPEMYYELRNPIRRLYLTPMNKVEQMLRPVVGGEWAWSLRFFVPKYAAVIGFIYLTAYFFKYNSQNWTRKTGWNVYSSKKSMVPGDVGYPNQPVLTDQDFADRGFKNRKVFLD